MQYNLPTSQLRLVDYPASKARHGKNGSDQVPGPAIGVANYRVETADSLEFMRSFESECMQLIVTSPPYNLGKKYEKKRTQDAYTEGQVAAIAEAVRLLHPKGSICWQVGNYVDDAEVFPLDILLYPKFKDHGLTLRNRIVWTFGHGLHCQRRFSGRHETILWFTSFNYNDSNAVAVQHSASIHTCQATPN